MDKILLPATLIAVLALTACSGSNGADGTNGQNGLQTLMSIVDAGSACPNGGSQVNAGLDLNGNGVLDANEITSSTYVCNGTPNTAPISNAGPDQRVSVGAVVTLDGSASSDPDGNPIKYAWKLSTTPFLSQAVLSSATGAQPTFLADKPGKYEITLVSSDGWFDGTPDTVVVWAGMLIPDTGQTTKYSTGYGDDSDYSINPMSFVDKGDGTIADNVTGLTWQKCSLGLSGVICATGTASTYNWTDASTACAALGVGWRLPTDLELMSIVDYELYGPAINTTYFPNTQIVYWSSTPYGLDSTRAWQVDDYGFVTDGAKTGLRSVRCVRGY